MADHRAEQIAERLAVILNNLPTTGENIFKGRVHALDDSKIPALAFYADSETPIDEYSNTLTDRLLMFIIEGFVKTTDAAIDTQLNQIRKEVTIAINADRKLGLPDFVIDTLQGEANYVLDGEGDRAIGVISTQWAVQYRHSTLDPSK